MSLHDFDSAVTGIAKRKAAIFFATRLAALICIIAIWYVWS